MYPEHWIGLLAILTVLTLGAVLGRAVGLPPAAGAYCVGLLLALLGWWMARRRSGW